MTINAKHVLSGLTQDQVNHPVTQKVIAAILEEYDRTGYGITVIRWIEETYQIKLVA